MDSNTLPTISTTDPYSTEQVTPEEWGTLPLKLTNSCSCPNSSLSIQITFLEGSNTL